MSDRPRAGSRRGLTLHPVVRDASLDVALSGELDMAAAFRFESELDRLLATPDIRGVALDLGDVGFLDSAGLGALLSIRDQAARLGLEFKLARTSDPVRRILDTTATRSALGG
jgi:anti-sigma B factor antagonist